MHPKEEEVSENSAPADTKEESVFNSFDQGVKYCRICFDKNGNFIAPCRCSGSMRFVHPLCIDKWIKHSSSLTCGICGVKMKKKKTYRRVPFNKKNVLSILIIIAWILFYVPLLLWFSCKISYQMDENHSNFVIVVTSSSVFLVLGTILACLALMVSLLVWRSCHTLYLASYTEEILSHEEINPSTMGALMA